MMRVEVLDEAEQDLVDGAHFYEAQEPHATAGRQPFR